MKLGKIKLWSYAWPEVDLNYTDFNTKMTPWPETKQKCVKCGSHEYNMKWHEKPCCTAADTLYIDGEHLHYYCQICGYDWMGPTMDSERGENA